MHPEGAKCVLVVEDDDDAREMMCELVAMTGCAAVGASNGAEALTLLEGMRPCLIVLDLMMPVMDGATTLGALRAKPDLSDIPVLIATSAPDRAPRGVPVLGKPIDPKDLWSVIRSACSCDAPK